MLNIEFKVEFKGEGRARKIGAGEVVAKAEITGEGHKVEKK